MRTVSPRHWCYGVAVCCLLVALSGCRNRGVCGGSCFSANQFANQATIAPPATYSLTIPGSPNAIALNNGGSGTTNQAPVRQATNTQPLNNGVNVQNGWVPAGSTSTTNSTIQGSQSTLPANNSTSGLNSQSQQNIRVAQNQTQLVNVNPINRPAVSGSSSRSNVASNTQSNVAAQTNGLSFTDATNFRSTAVDERLDQSRLPVTDASLVRAPTNFSPTTSVGQFSAPYYVPQQQLATVQRFNNGSGNRVIAVPQLQQVPQQPIAPQYQQVVQANNRVNTTVGSFGQPAFAQPPQQNYQGLATQNPQVLAQSTVYADPATDPNLNSAWRDRDLTAGRDQLNR